MTRNSWPNLSTPAAGWGWGWRVVGWGWGRNENGANWTTSLASLLPGQNPVEHKLSALYLSIFSFIYYSFFYLWSGRCWDGIMWAEIIAIFVLIYSFIIGMAVAGAESCDQILSAFYWFICFLFIYCWLCCCRGWILRAKIVSFVNSFLWLQIWQQSVERPDTHSVILKPFFSNHFQNSQMGCQVETKMNHLITRVTCSLRYVSATKNLKYCSKVSYHFSHHCFFLFSLRCVKVGEMSKASKDNRV